MHRHCVTRLMVFREDPGCVSVIVDANNGALWRLNWRGKKKQKRCNVGESTIYQWPIPRAICIKSPILIGHAGGIKAFGVSSLEQIFGKCL